MKWPWTKLDKPYALPSSLIGGHGPDDYTWERWEEDNKAKFPIRFWFQETVPSFARQRVLAPIERAWYQFRSRTFAKEHIVDLRSRTYDPMPYEFGWKDSDEKILLAAFNILKKFVDEDMPTDAFFDAVEETVEKTEDDKKLDDFNGEVLELYNWWTKTRKYEHEEVLSNLNRDKDYSKLF